MFLSAYNYEIEYIKANCNTYADCMSRYAISENKYHKINVINSDRLNMQAIHSISDDNVSNFEVERDQPPSLDVPGDFCIVASQQADPNIRAVLQKLPDNTASDHIKTHHAK